MAGNRTMRQDLQILKGMLLLLTFILSNFGVIFFIWKHNFYAAYCCVQLDIVSVVSLHFTYTVLKEQLQVKYDLTKLKALFLISTIVAVAQFSAILTYSALGGMYKQDFRIEDNGFYAATIPCSLTCLCASVLAYESRFYMEQFKNVGVVNTRQIPETRAPPGVV